MMASTCRSLYSKQSFMRAIPGAQLSLRPLHGLSRLAYFATSAPRCSAEAQGAAVSTRIEYKNLPSGDRVAHMWFQGQKKYPIMNTAFTRELQKLIPEAVSDHDNPSSRIRALFLRTTIVGADLTEIQQIKTRNEGISFISAVDSLCDTIQRLRIPVVYVLDGSCLGAGFEVASSCDMRIGVEGSMFGMPETKLGLPSPAQARLIPNIIGWGRARELLYLGDPIDAKTAYEWGFLNALVSESGLDAKLEEWEKRIDGTGHKALMRQKELMMAWEKYRESVLVGIEAFGDTFEDASEPAAMIQRFYAGRKSKSK